MTRWRHRSLTVAAPIGLALAAGCSSASESAPEKPRLVGVYEASSPGAITSMAFDGAAHYFIWRSPCGESVPCREEGSYTLDGAQTEIRFTNRATGVATALPFKVTGVGHSLTAQNLDLLQEGPLVPGQGGPLTQGGGPLVQGFEAGNQLFKGACSPLVGPEPVSLIEDPPRCTNRPIRVNGQVVENDARGEWCEYGACGRSRQATCRNIEEETSRTRSFAVCETGAVKCKRCRFRRIECGSHQACVGHDACYERAMRDNDHDSWAQTWANRQCDLEVANQYPVAEWNAWRQGQPGPSGFDRWLPFHEELGCEVTDGACE